MPLRSSRSRPAAWFFWSTQLHNGVSAGTTPPAMTTPPSRVSRVSTRRRSWRPRTRRAPRNVRASEWRIDLTQPFAGQRSLRLAHARGHPGTAGGDGGRSTGGDRWRSPARTARTARGRRASGCHRRGVGGRVVAGGTARRRGEFGAYARLPVAACPARPVGVAVRARRLSAGRSGGRRGRAPVRPARAGRAAGVGAGQRDRGGAAVAGRARVVAWAGGGGRGAGGGCRPGRGPGGRGGAGRRPGPGPRPAGRP